MTRDQFAFVHTEYVVEVVAVTGPPVALAEASSLDWHRIRQGALFGGLFGALLSVTAGDLDSTVSLLAGVMNVAAAFAILGGLWGAVFFSPEEEA